MKITKLRTFILVLCVIIISMLLIGWRKNIEPFDCENDNDNENCSMMTYDEHHDIHTKWRDMGYYSKLNSNLPLNNTSSEEPSHNLSAIHFGNKTTIKNCPGGICDDISPSYTDVSDQVETSADDNTDIGAGVISGNPQAQGQGQAEVSTRSTSGSGSAGSAGTAGTAGSAGSAGTAGTAGSAGSRSEIRLLEPGLGLGDGLGDGIGYGFEYEYNGNIDYGNIDYGDFD